MSQRSKKLNLSRRQLLIAGLAIVLVAGILAIWLWPHKTVTNIPSTSPVKQQPAANSSSSSQSSSSSNTESSSGAGQQPSDKNQTNSPAASGEGPLKPYGNFVSNHHPGGSNPTTEASVCITSPGATCYIQFTNGGEVKKLDSQTADSSGSVYWYWDTKTAGMSSGSWTITAVAEMNGQTASASDNQLLVVQ